MVYRKITMTWIVQAPDGPDDPDHPKEVLLRHCEAVEEFIMDSDMAVSSSVDWDDQQMPRGWKPPADA